MGERPLEGPDAFVAFYREHAHALLAFFARRTLDAEVAADLTAETFAAAYAVRGRFRERGEGSGPWLYGIARNKLSRYYRSSRVEVEARARIGLPEQVSLSEGDIARIEELVDFAATGEAVRAALRELSESDREALSLRVVDARSYREIAALLGCSEQAARVRVSRGLQRLDGLLAS
jgi:RNA polymerase sigma-70 factor (ECF subfamily)